MGSKSKSEIMKANPILKNETTQKNQKKENAPDIVSKSIINHACRMGGFKSIIYEYTKKQSTINWKCWTKTNHYKSQIK